MKKIQSTCNYCAIDCNLDFYVENNRVVKTVPTKGYPVNDGFCCIKGLSLDKQQQTVKPGSLPKIRREDGSFREVSWEEGFQHVADKLKSFRQNTAWRVWQESVPASLLWKNLPSSAML